MIIMELKQIYSFKLAFSLEFCAALCAVGSRLMHPYGLTIPWLHIQQN